MEFLYVDDLASFLRKRYEDPEFLNVGNGEDFQISEFIEIVSGVLDVGTVLPRRITTQTPVLKQSCAFNFG
jgi:nucleoside-diphosphate-sugar epimerase